MVPLLKAEAVQPLGHSDAAEPPPGPAQAPCVAEGSQPQPGQERNILHSLSGPAAPAELL